MKRIYTIFIASLFAIAASAEENSDDKIRFGVEIGVNRSSVSEWVDETDSDYGVYYVGRRTGFNIGVTVDFPLSKLFHIKSGVFYTEKGFLDKNLWTWDENYGYRVYLDHSNYSAGYIEVPVLASFRIDLCEKHQLQLNVGPYFAYGVAEDYFKSASDGGFELDKKFDYGIQASVYLRFSNHYLIGGGYEFGLAKPFDDWAYDNKNNNLFINVGYVF